MMFCTSLRNRNKMERTYCCRTAPIALSLNLYQKGPSECAVESLLICRAGMPAILLPVFDKLTTIYGNAITAHDILKAPNDGLLTVSGRLTMLNDN